ncbi:MAG: crossover junction endodeoxyribonuclease RuvC [Paludibacteraceae bacterium]|nr:crossover junction endodeoxyribonuclease RuvC [Paludibacteraceae bacterium]
MKVAQAQEKIILGIDPGTNVMGFGVIRVCGKNVSFLDMGTLDMKKTKDPYLKLKQIFDFTTELIERFLPDEFAIEAQFFGKNVQSMLKLGRAQGVAIAAALERDVPICEYAPLKIKMAITGNGQASKEQVADMLHRFLKIPNEKMQLAFDATDALAVAYCHFLQASRPATEKKYKSWNDFVNSNSSRVVRNTK